MRGLPDKDDPMFGAPIIHGDQTQKGGRKQAISLPTSFLKERKSGYIRHLASRLAADIALPVFSFGVWHHIIEKLCRQYRIIYLILSPLATYDKRIGRAVLSRLAWRCHFMQKLEDEPSIETHAMHPFYEKVLIAIVKLIIKPGQKVYRLSFDRCPHAVFDKDGLVARMGDVGEFCKLSFVA